VGEESDDLSAATEKPSKKSISRKGKKRVLPGSAPERGILWGGDFQGETQLGAVTPEGLQKGEGNIKFSSRRDEGESTYMGIG